MATDETIDFTEKSLFTLFHEADQSCSKGLKKLTGKDYYDKINTYLPSSCKIIANSDTAVNSSITKYTRKRTQKSHRRAS